MAGSAILRSPPIDVSYERPIVFVFLALLGVLAIVGAAATVFETTYKGARPIPTHHIGSH